MLSVILIWIYILFTTYMIGRGVITFARKCCIVDVSYEPTDPVCFILAGLVSVTVGAGIWSIFGGVGLAANLTLLILSVAIGIYLRKTQGSVLLFRDILTGRARSKGKAKITTIACPVAALLLFLFMAYGSSHGIMHYDTGLYHAQAIHWIEEYGSVPGLANLHTRLGYNSSAFALNALYSFSFTGRSFHVTAGFVAFLLAWECVMTPVLRRSSFISLPGMARAAGLYYLFMVYDEVVSPASDYYMVCLAFILVIRWLDADNPNSYILLSYLAAFILTIKLSGGILILLSIYPAFMLIRKKRYGSFALSVLIVACILAPYLIRNVIISGRLLYPSTAFDFFDVPWKVPRGIAEYDYREIQVYGRGFTDVSRYDSPLREWFIPWFNAHSMTDRALIGLSMVAVLYFVIQCIVKARDRHGSERFVTGVIIVSLVFWLLTSPLMRYGCLYVYLTDALVWGGALVRLEEKLREKTGYRKSAGRLLRVCMVLSLCVVCAYKCVRLIGEIADEYRPDTWVLQQDYERYATYAYPLNQAEGSTELQGIKSVTIYAPLEGDRTGYYDFPSSPWDMSGNIYLRGDDIRNGFAPYEGSD